MTMKNSRKEEVEEIEEVSEALEVGEAAEVAASEEGKMRRKLETRANSQACEEAQLKLNICSRRES